MSCSATGNLGVGSAVMTSSMLIKGCETTTGMCGMCHDYNAICQLADIYSKIALPQKFSAGLSVGREIQGAIGKVFYNPFCASVTCTVPVSMDFVQSTIRGGNGSTSYEFNIMRTVDFIGRNYLMLKLPSIDCSEIKDQGYTSGNPYDHTYLGAWHRDLIPRIINCLSFYSRSNSHTLFEYSGYDIYLFNLIFGNAQKELNDVMAGEDKFELAYDPYYVNGAALGLSSFKGVDPFKSLIEDESGALGVDPFAALDLVIDNCMDNEEFREFYRRGVWFEPPVARNHSSRHSIHSRRLVHNEKTLWIPLDILPFGYSISSSIPIGALHGDVGYIHLDIYQNWLDRAFYLTRISDIPSICPMPNHVHLPNGWVDTKSIGKTDNTYAADHDDDDEESDERPSKDGLADIIENSDPNRKTDALKVVAPNATGGGYTSNGKKDSDAFQTPYGVNKRYAKGKSSDIIETTIYPMSKISPTYYEQVKNQLGVSLMQVGYKTLPCIRDVILKFPELYLTTEWHDCTYTPGLNSHFEILNDLYIEAIGLWFIPEDSNGIESVRMYPNHYIDHELPVVNKIRISNENGQGISTYSWDMLNTVIPSVLKLQNPLLENLGIISFTPELVSNTFPLCYYDTNLNGQLRIDILPFEGENSIGDRRLAVNMKRGRLLILPIGINGLAIANLNIYRVVY